MKKRVAKALIERINRELKEIEEMATTLLGPEKAKVWMKVQNLNLGGNSPEQLVAANRGYKVKQFVQTALDEKFAAEGKRSGAV